MREHCIIVLQKVCLIGRSGWGVLSCSTVSVEFLVDFHTGTRSMVCSKLDRFQPLSNVILFKQCGVAVSKNTLVRNFAVVTHHQGTVGSRSSAAEKLNK